MFDGVLVHDGTEITRILGALCRHETWLALLLGERSSLVPRCRILTRKPSASGNCSTLRHTH